MVVIFLRAAMVRRIGADSMHSEISLDVVDDVGRVVDVSAARRGLCAEIFRAG